MGVGRHRGGTANDGNFQNDSMLLQGAVLMAAPVGHGVTFRKEDEASGNISTDELDTSRFIIGAAYSNLVCV